MNDEIMQLIDNNRNLIYKIASNYSLYYNIDDLFQAGVLGLLDAKKHYRNNDIKFSTYAYKYILGQIIDYIKKDRNILVNSNSLKIYKLYEKAKDYLSQKMEKDVSFEEVCLYMEIPTQEVYDAINCASFTLSLDCEFENADFYNFISTNDDIVDNKILINDEIDKLDEFDKAIIDCRYYKDYSQDETANYLGVSQVKVSRSEKKILQKMHKSLTT